MSVVVVAVHAPTGEIITTKKQVNYLFIFHPERLLFVPLDDSPSIPADYLPFDVTLEVVGPSHYDRRWKMIIEC